MSFTPRGCPQRWVDDLNAKVLVLSIAGEVFEDKSTSSTQGNGLRLQNKFAMCFFEKLSVCRCVECFAISAVYCELLMSIFYTGAAMNN